NASAPV
nr:Chain E, Presegetalin A1 [Gypsophila vaccaria]5UW6_F Chain F, Presegetalin A1 [Gypsophila vaccaria]5UW6_G Chain G, Presegetalin A1 [Gypsophila vaccaria]5UW6_H Chain H, Presegetalin A1 [Gypsophila vaccaria]5UZW_E Chain E, Presegetalin A1 [Gypsophila vaccaria]5UZW_F Chain F, Presegetalin A1 [Gypsophila vaccaria]5UZW_G Chain G, Presegetalin A1 [Gypsophila vaccaria]5UZW_H Chain H, Presegetalin A1 [Gypsophila vaccaria]